MLTIINNKRAFAFEATLPDGEVATLTYRWLKGSMVLMHTIVPKGDRGHGYGEELVKHVLDHARTHGLKVIVYCSFAAKYMEAHPEYNDLLDEAHSK